MPGYRLSETSSNFINCLRAVSSQLVLIGHALHLNLIIDHPILSTIPSYAVLIFFVLSGFVISYSSSIKGKNYGYSNYMIDRFSRIFVAFVPALIFTLLLGIVFNMVYGVYPFAIDAKYFVSNILMQHENPVLQQLQYMLPPGEDYYFLGFFGDNLPLWSLSIEWWLYLFFGFLFFTGGSERFNKWHYLLFILSLPFAIGYAIVPGRAGYGLTFIWFSGVIVNYLLAKFEIPKKYSLLSVVFLIITAITFAKGWYISIVFFAAFFYTALSHFNSVSSTSMFNLFFKFFKWPSNYSYSLYIIHYPILLILLKVIDSPVVCCVLTFVLGNLSALIFYWTFESKYKRLTIFLKGYLISGRKK